MIGFIGTHSIFVQHAVLAAISGLSLVVATLVGALLTRKMARIEIAVNGRIDQLLKETEAKAKAEAAAAAAAKVELPS